MIIYDQPLNEIMRVCLRLEQLFQQIDHQLHDTSLLGTRNVINCIINLLHMLDRPDLKTKLVKEINHFQTNILRYNDAPNVDANKLNDVVEQLESAYQHLINSNGKIGYRLREIELLNTLRLHLAGPGNGCSFDIPLYHYWLEQPAKDRQATIIDWLSEFTQIRDIIHLILELVRNDTRQEEKLAVHGFYQELLDPQLNLRMLRIGLKNSLAAFPEISVGRHFLSVRFYFPDIDKRPTQYMENLPFYISYCEG